MPFNSPNRLDQIEARIERLVEAQQQTELSIQKLTEQQAENSRIQQQIQTSIQRLIRQQADTMVTQEYHEARLAMLEDLFNWQQRREEQN